MGYALSAQHSTLNYHYPHSKNVGLVKPSPTYACVCTTFPETDEPCKFFSNVCRKLLSEVPELEIPSADNRLLKLLCSDAMVPLVVAEVPVAAVVPVTAEVPVAAVAPVVLAASVPVAALVVLPDPAVNC